MRKRKRAHRRWQRGKGKTGLEEAARGRNETRSSSGKVVPTKQKTRTRRAHADADMDGDVNVDGAEGCFPTSRSWHAEKLFRGKGRRLHCATRNGFPLALRKQFLFDARERRVPPEFARRVFDDSSETTEKPEGDK